MITVCGNAKERCPLFPAKAKKFHQNFPDPAKTTETQEEIDEKFRQGKTTDKRYCSNFVADNLQPEKDDLNFFEVRPKI